MPPTLTELIWESRYITFCVQPSSDYQNHNVIRWHQSTPLQSCYYFNRLQFLFNSTFCLFERRFNEHFTYKKMKASKVWGMIHHSIESSWTSVQKHWNLSLTILFMTQNMYCAYSLDHTCDCQLITKESTLFKMKSFRIEKHSISFILPLTTQHLPT